MGHYIHYRDPHSPEMKEFLASLPTVPGTCIFIDITNSTAIKYSSEIEHWGKLLNNTFNLITFLNDFPDNIVKGIGDEIMLYIPDDALKAKQDINNYFSLLFEIFATLDNIKNFPLEDLFLNCKVGMHYCTEVYNITYFKGYNDYYGKDIDLSARLMSKAKINRIVISEPYYKKVQEDLEVHPHYKDSKLLSLISGKYIEDFKGVPSSTEFRVIDV